MSEWRYRMGMALARWMLEAADWLRDRAERLETYCWEHVRPRVTVPLPKSLPLTDDMVQPILEITTGPRPDPHAPADRVLP